MTSRDLAGDELGSSTHRFKLLRRLGSGSFGDLYEGLILGINRKVAIKTEMRQSPTPQLAIEYEKYKAVSGAVGFPKLYFFGPLKRNPDHHGLVMTLLGKSLIELYAARGQKLTEPTILQVAVQVIERLKVFHQKGYIHRDIKPDNFMIGRPDEGTDAIIHMIDMGLAKKFIDSRGRHIPQENTGIVLGTKRFMSFHAHSGGTAARRDDMEAIGYMFAWLFKGYLPWSGAPAGKFPMRPGEAKDNFMIRSKRDTPPEVICEGMDLIFANYLRLVKCLDFEEEPHYDAYMDMFEGVLKFRYGSRIGVFDWPTTRPRQ